MGVSPKGVEGAKPTVFLGSNTTGMEFNIRPKAGSSMFINVHSVFFEPVGPLILGGVEI